MPNVPNTYYQEVRKLNPSPYIELFSITPPVGLAGSPPSFYLTPSSQTAISFGGQSFTPFPIEVQDVEHAAGKEISRPKLVLSDVTRFVSPYSDQWEDFVEFKVTRTRTLLKYLDGQPTADSTQREPLQIWYVNRKLTQTKASLTYELRGMLDLPNDMLPGRKTSRDIDTDRTLYAPGLGSTRFRGY